MFIITDQDGNPIYTAGYALACHEHINDAINEYGIGDASKWKVVEVVPKQRELELLAVIKDLCWSMRMLLSGSCTCLTKTPVYHQHKENCTYRLLQEALVKAEVPSQALREHEAKVLEEAADEQNKYADTSSSVVNRLRRMAEERRKK